MSDTTIVFAAFTACLEFANASFQEVQRWDRGRDARVIPASKLVHHTTRVLHWSPLYTDGSVHFATQPMRPHFFFLFTYFSVSCTLAFVNKRSSAHLQVNVLFAQIGRSEGRRRLMWRSTSKPLFISSPPPVLLSFFICLSIIFICHAAREGRFIWGKDQEEEDEEEGGEQKGQRWRGGEETERR